MSISQLWKELWRHIIEKHPWIKCTKKSQPIILYIRARKLYMTKLCTCLGTSCDSEHSQILQVVSSECTSWKPRAGSGSVHCLRIMIVYKLETHRGNTLPLPMSLEGMAIHTWFRGSKSELNVTRLHTPLKFLSGEHENLLPGTPLRILQKGFKLCPLRKE